MEPLPNEKEVLREAISSRSAKYVDLCWTGILPMIVKSVRMLPGQSAMSREGAARHSIDSWSHHQAVKSISGFQTMADLESSKSVPLCSLYGAADSRGSEKQ
jgi:hypothetical protein